MGGHEGIHDTALLLQCCLCLFHMEWTFLAIELKYSQIDGIVVDKESVDGA